MRIALVHNYHSDATPSGENVVVDAEADALARAGHDVEVVAVRNDEMARARLHTLKGAATVVSGIGVSPEPALDAFRPDVVHVHNLFPYFGRRWVRRQRAPIVTTLHSYRPLCANGYLFRDGHVCTQCPDGDPWAGVRYGCYRDSRVATLPLALANRGADPLLDAASAAIVLSQRAEQVFTDAGLAPGRLVRDWHFVPDRLAPPPPASAGAALGDFWLFVGRLTPEKGIDRLVAEWPAGTPLVVVGEGELRPRLEALARGKQVRLAGALPRSQVLERMREAAGLVVPSLWYETFGLAYIEALSVGLPVLAFPPNTVADAVAAEDTGVVAHWGALPRALGEAGKSFGALRTRCREVFDERYSERAWVARRLALYERVRFLSPGERKLTRSAVKGGRR